MFGSIGLFWLAVPAAVAVGFSGDWISVEKQDGSIGGKRYNLIFKIFPTIIAVLYIPLAIMILVQTNILSAQLPELGQAVGPLGQFSICVDALTNFEDGLLVQQIMAEEAINSFINARTMILLIVNFILPLTILIIAFQCDVVEEEKDIPLADIDPEAEFIKNDQ